MSTAHWIQTSLEVVMIAALILGFIYEPILVKWEEKQKEALKNEVQSDDPKGTGAQGTGAEGNGTAPEDGRNPEEKE